MSLVINHNISAMNTQRNLERSSGSLSKSLQKLSSGFKINVAADDPSGLIISEQLRSQTNALERAVSNSQEASNVIGIAEGALIEMNDILRHLRGLAIHAANSGVTAPDQIRADQSELDSSIQTIDRIAATTKYSDQFLLNGSKGLIYDTNLVAGNSLIDTAFTRLDQVFKRTGLVIGVNFTGEGTATGVAAMTNQAQRAMFEADSGTTNDEIGSAINNVNILTANQDFIITGNQGSRQFSFSTGTDIAQVVSSIENVADSTGVHSALTLASTATTDIAGAGLGDLSAFDIYGMQTGVNTDAQGNLWFAQDAAANTISVYSDVAGTNLVASGTYTNGGGTSILQEQNNSGIWGTVVTADTGNIAVGATTGVQAKSVTDSGAGTLVENNDASSYVSNWRLNGIDVGANTDSEGRMYVSLVDMGAGNWQVDVYSDSNRSNLVAQSGTVAAGTANVPLTLQNSSGLAGYVDVAGGVAADTTINLRPRLGTRLYSDEYGADKYVRIQADNGKMWEYYDSALSQYTRVDSTTTSVTSQVNGQDATVFVNGTQTLISGLDAEITTPVFSGKMQFQNGSLNATTIAQVGYDRGTASSQIGSMFDNNNLAVNPGENSSENIQNIRNGMQYQLTDSEGDQGRTIYAIPSMSIPNLGRVNINGTNYSLQNILGGGVASLSKDPVIAMKVINQAIDDVSSLRARLGAFQKNMLQTNVNSLNVAIENITMTESAIRDANMASESAEFTKNQILVQAGTAMLAQANVISQNVLKLLG